jgi:hypothetical protein
MTPLDTAHADMTEAPEDDDVRLRFYDRLAAAELFVMLEAEAQGQTILPAVFDTEDGRIVLVFDTEERLSSFAGGTVPYAALSGRVLCALLASEQLGIALNPEVAPSSFLIPAEAVSWLAATVSEAPEELEARPARFAAPRHLPEKLVTALSARLAAAAGLARCAWLAAVTYEDGTQGHLLGIAGAEPWAHAALGKTVQEALVFSGLEAGSLDVVFVQDHDLTTAELARVGLRFDLPEPAVAPAPAAPGMDPDAPPRLR